MEYRVDKLHYRIIFSYSLWHKVTHVLPDFIGQFYGTNLVFFGCFQWMNRVRVAITILPTSRPYVIFATIFVAFPWSFFFIYFACSHWNHAKVDNLLVSDLYTKVSLVNVYWTNFKVTGFWISYCCTVNRLFSCQISTLKSKFAQFEVSTQPLLLSRLCSVTNSLSERLRGSANVLLQWSLWDIIVQRNFYSIWFLWLELVQSHIRRSTKFTWFSFMKFGFVESFPYDCYFYFFFRNMFKTAQLLRSTAFKWMKSDYILFQHTKHLTIAYSIELCNWKL